jgi:multidrug efflux pump subunit AcrB
LEAGIGYARDESALQNLYITSPTGQSVPLTEFAQLQRTYAAATLERDGQIPSLQISFNLSPGVSLGNGLAAIKRMEGEITLPATVTTGFKGAAREFQKSQTSQLLLIVAAVLTVYVVLGILYESFLHPITILSTLPSAGLGALLGLKLMGQDLDNMGLIGIFLLIGIVKKNAIMMIDFAVVAERQRGATPSAAIQEAAAQRFRPILMTTVAALLGALPLALAHGAGAELRVPLGVSLVCGLILSQALTLFTTPVIYLFLSGLAGANILRFFWPARLATQGKS